MFRLFLGLVLAALAGYFSQQPLLALSIFALLLAVFARGFRWLLSVYSASIFFVWAAGGVSAFPSAVFSRCAGLVHIGGRFLAAWLCTSRGG